MKRANGQGTIVKLSGNRRRPYAIKLTTGYTEDGKLQYKYLSYHQRRRDAERALALYNQDPYTLSKYTFKELYDEWIEIQKATKAASTISNHESAIKHLKPLWDVRVQEIDRLTLQHFYTKINVTPSVVDNIHRTLQGVITYAVKLGIMPLSMLNVQKVLDTTPGKKGKQIEHILIPEDLRKYLWKHTDDNMVKIILFYIYTGLRYKELYNLQPEDIFDDHIVIRQAKTEAGIREVPICDRIKPLMPLPPIPKYTTFLKQFHEVLPEHMPHDTRHTFITLMTEAGVDLRIIQAIVGHSRKANVTERYTHITLKTKMKAVNKLPV